MGGEGWPVFYHNACTGEAHGRQITKEERQP